MNDNAPSEVRQLPDLFSISDLAKRAGISTSKTRHYQRLGLLKPVRISRFRFYTPADVTKLQRISALQKLGLPLKTILPMLGQLPADGLLIDIPFVAEAVKYHQEKRARRQRRSEP